jgi:nucleoside-diphosphate-sugar epimerase
VRRLGLRIAITGAAGFVGRPLARLLSASGHEVVGVVRSEGSGSDVVAHGGRAFVAPGLVGGSLANAFAGCRAVVHLAQIGSEEGDATYESVNVAGTRAVAEAALAASVPRVVVFSGLGVARIGQKPRCTNRYFLSKLEAEVELFRSGLEIVVFRPSFIVGPGNAFVTDLVREIESGEVERPGDGAYRLQPIAVRDAAALVLAALERKAPPPMHGGGSAPLVYDLVGNEPVSYQQLLERVAAVAHAHGRGGELRVREVSLADADAQARAGGWHGMAPDVLDCLLCDEISDAAPLEALLGRFLIPLDEALGAALGRS